MIPIGWTEKPLKAVLKLTSGESRPKEIMSEPKGGHTYPVYGGNGILGYSIVHNSVADDIIIGRVGEYCGVTRFVAGPKWITDNALFAKSVDSGVDREFLALRLRHFDVSKLRSKGGQPLVSQEPIYAQTFAFPPIDEQKSIVSAIMTWDRAIETVEALIANARTQKKALMQSLLTGKKRPPGFAGGWVTVTLDKAAQIIVSNVDKKSSDAERAVRLCNYMDVYRSDRIEADMDFMVATAADAQIRKFGLRVGDVLVTKDSETPGDIAIPSYVASTAPDLVCGYHLAIIRPRNGTDGLFLKFYFEHPHTRHFFASRANGATRFGLTIDAIQTAPITLPSYDEQKRIGEVIGAAELEITRLHPIAAALRQEKAALMQQLLTGKRRVKVDFEGETC